MVPIGIWLVLLGYAVAYTGIVNSGLQGTPQSDGSVSWSGTPMTVWGALTGSNPGGGTTSPTTRTGSSTTPTSSQALTPPDATGSSGVLINPDAGNYQYIGQLVYPTTTAIGQTARQSAGASFSAVGTGLSTVGSSGIGSAIGSIFSTIGNGAKSVLSDLGI